MPSVRRQATRLGVLATCATLLAGSLAGCTTTQEKAAAHKAEAERILDAREKRQEKRRKDKQKGDKK